MAFIPGTNIAQVNLLFTLDAQQVENVMYWKCDQAITQTMIDQLHPVITTFFGTELSVHLSNELTLNSIRYMDLTSDTSPVYVKTTNLPMTGDVATDPLPNSDAFVISLRTGNRGRSGRGRQYVPALPDTSVNGSSLQVSTADALLAAYKELIDFPPTNWVWGVASRYNNNAPRAAILFQPITTVIYTSLVMGTMRKRLPER